MDVATPQETQYFYYEDHTYDAPQDLFFGTQDHRLRHFARSATPISINTKLDDSRIVEIYKALEQVAQSPRR